jgi:DNA-binding protein WhiA
MRNSVNRRVNCDTANLNKTVSAAVKQIEDIKYIRDTVGLSKLSNNLQEIAKLRWENGDASLKELGEMLDPKVGKSGVNHRLRKISEIADGLRSK